MNDENTRLGTTDAEPAGTTMEAAESNNAHSSESNVADARNIMILDLEACACDEANDPCDLCEDALPGYVLGELSVADQEWINEHTAECNYCRNELESFQHLEALLTECCNEPLPEMTCPRASWSHVQSPIGQLSVAVSAKGVCEIGFGWIEDDVNFAGRLIERGYQPVRDDKAIERVASELNAYLSGEQERFNVPVDLSGLTEFSRSVLAATASVPFGETRTYGEIARSIGQPGASRAVGNALNKNPVPLIVPCHRIVPTGGGIGNYAGTPQVKAQLLALEGAIPGGQPFASFA